MRRRTPLIALITIALAGCGTPSADLFAVERAGTGPGARLRMVVSDGGTVSCDGHKPVSITDSELLDARNLQHDLTKPADAGLRLAPGPASVLRYRVHTPDGTVAFADDSRAKPAVFNRLVLYVRRLAVGRCRLAR